MFSIWCPSVLLESSLIFEEFDIKNDESEGYELLLYTASIKIYFECIKEGVGLERYPSGSKS